MLKEEVTKIEVIKLFNIIQQEQFTFQTLMFVIPENFMVPVVIVRVAIKENVQ